MYTDEKHKNNNQSERNLNPAPVGLYLNNARLAFSNIPIFENLSAEISAGKWTCILGPSGVGKSALLRMIVGLGPKDPVTEISASDGSSLTEKISWMAQQDLLLPWLSVSKNVALGSHLRGIKPNKEKVSSLLNDVGMYKYCNDLPKILSGGQKQRVALARTLMEGRPIVLMDEPFSSVDAITRSRLQELAAKLLTNRTVLLVTHDPLEALRLGHNLFVMSGKPAKLGPVMQPADNIPRDPSNYSLQKIHSSILSQLETAVTESK
ncbi:MAG: ABC transporter ATP-binding protein [Alphaproteobacteria bacterium]|nr:ABC transporter ATP-binding protein [Alphaproteobacteria bacterium]|tara:strand:- start:2245 stop:3039 length:795 start_codon:yes stop_codon:yes gene_type:complete